MTYSLIIAAHVGAILPRRVENIAKIKHQTREAAEAAAVKARKNPHVAEVWVQEVDTKPDSVNYSLEIVGITWGGFRGVYQYTISADAAAALENAELSAAQRYAGDFQAVTDFRLVRCEHFIEGNAPPYNRRDVYTTLRGFRSGTMTPRKFHRLINGF